MAEHRTAEVPTDSHYSIPPLTGPLRFRVIGTARHGQVIEIAAPRVSIGSGPHCTLRLRAAGVNPLQCLIVRQPDGPIVRCLSPETLLNGQKFREEPLRRGDRLQVGSIELELCDDGPSANQVPNPVALNPPTQTPAVGPAASCANLEAPVSHSVELLARLERLEKLFQDLQYSETIAGTESNDKTPDPHQTSDSVSPPLPAAALNLPADWSEKLATQTDELRQVRAELALAHVRHEQVQSLLGKVEQELASYRSSCDQQLSDLNRERDKLELELATECGRRGELHRKLDEQSAHWELQLSAFQTQCDEQISRLIREKTELEQALTTESNLRGELARRHDEQSTQWFQELNTIRKQCEEQLSRSEERLAELEQALTTESNLRGEAARRHDEQSAQWLQELNSFRTQCDEQLSRSEERLADLEQALSSEGNHRAELARRHDEQSAQWLQELSRIRTQCDGQRSRSEERLADLEQTLSNERNHRGELERKLDEQITQVTGLTAQCQSLQADFLRKPVESPGVIPCSDATAKNSDATAVVSSDPRAMESYSQQRRLELSWFAQQLTNACNSPADQPQVTLAPSTVQASANSETSPDTVPEPHPVAESGSDLPAGNPSPADSTPPTIPELQLAGEMSDESTYRSADALPVAENSETPEFVLDELSGNTELPAVGLVTDSTANIELDFEDPAADSELVIEQSDQEVTIAGDYSDREPDAVEEDLLFAKVDDKASVAESVIARLAQAGIWKDSAHERDDRTSTHLVPERTAPSAESAADDCPVEKNTFEPREAAWKQSSTGNTGGDDSIESYMERLMQRVRGDSGPPTVAVQPDTSSSDRSPRTEVALDLTEPPPPEEPGTLTESEYLPHRQAPEMSTGLGAMRAIGNDQRKKLIRRHAERTWAAKTRAKLIGSSLGISLAFGSFFFLDSHTELAAAGLFAGFGVASFWIWQAIHYRKQLFDSLRLNTEELTAQKPAKSPEDQNPRSAQTS